jgi:hypothetical protein
VLDHIGAQDYVEGTLGQIELHGLDVSNIDVVTPFSCRLGGLGVKLQADDPVASFDHATGEVAGGASHVQHAMSASNSIQKLTVASVGPGVEDVADVLSRVGATMTRGRFGREALPW